MTAAGSPLHGRYLATDWRLRALLTGSDLLLAPLRTRRAPAVPPLRRVLLSTNGHLGDAVIATAAIGLVADALPDVELGVLLPSWSCDVIAGDARITHVHTVDHWHASRARSGRFARWRTYRQSRHRALAELRSVGYDAAVDLYDYFSNAALLLWRAGIPIRIGFDAAGFSALYTQAVPWPDDDRHTAERQQLLVRTLLPALDPKTAPQPSLPPARPETVARVDELLARHGLTADAFTVMHPGAGAAEKSLPPAKWRELAEPLIAAGSTLVFTGRGAGEKDVIREITRGFPRCIDLSDALAWAEFVQLVRLARNLVALDSVAGHVAAAVGTPSVTLWTSSSSPQHWRPLGSSSVVLDGRDDSALDVARAHLAPAPLTVP